jgi:peptidoglycan/LPS O-acetylase OafA/YrhL
VGISDNFSRSACPLFHMRYSPPLDGIRAIAILAVLIFHISANTLRGGFTGVDVFFVLSGFLITSNILYDYGRGQFSFREFYLRRVQRLVPNSLLTVLVTILLWVFFMPPSTARQTAQHGLWTIINLSNFFIWKDLGGYWGNAAEQSPLTHTWSLAVEEQFYLIFPALLLLIAKVSPKRLTVSLIAGCIFSFVLCLYGTSHFPTPTFYLIPTRFWELLIGALLAVLRTPTFSGDPASRLAMGGRLREVIGAAGILMITAGFLFIRNGSSFPGFVSLAPTLGTFLILVSVADGSTRLSRLLSTRPLVLIGKVSYSLYLWHWPLITLGKALAVLHGAPQIFGSVAGGAVGVLLGAIAYAVVENPLRRRGPGRSRRFAIIATGFATTAIVGAATIHHRPVADPNHRFAPTEFFGETFSAGNAEGAADAIHSTRYYDVYFPPIPADRPKDLWRSGGVVHLYGGAHPQVVVLGSSHALMYSRLIDDICRDNHISVAFLGVDATPIFFDSTVNYNFSSASEARAFDDTRKHWLAEWRPNAVFLIDRWDTFSDSKRSFQSMFEDFLRQLCPYAGKVFLVAQVPAIQDGDQYNLREIVNWRMGKSNRLPLLYPDANEPFRRQSVSIAETEAEQFGNLRILRADLPFYAPQGSIEYVSGRSFLYADGNHLSEAGAEHLRDLFQSAINGMTANSPPDAVTKQRAKNETPSVSSMAPAHRRPAGQDF